MDGHDGLTIRIQPNRARRPDELDACEGRAQCLSARADLAVNLVQRARERLHGQVIRDHEQATAAVPRQIRKGLGVGPQVPAPLRALGVERDVSADDDPGEVHSLRRELVRLAQPVAVEHQARGQPLDLVTVRAQELRGAVEPVGEEDTVGLASEPLGQASVRAGGDEGTLGVHRSAERAELGHESGRGGPARCGVVERHGSTAPAQVVVGVRGEPGGRLRGIGRESEDVGLRVSQRDLLRGGRREQERDVGIACGELPHQKALCLSDRPDDHIHVLVLDQPPRFDDQRSGRADLLAPLDELDRATAGAPVPLLDRQLGARERGVVERLQKARALHQHSHAQRLVVIAAAGRQGERRGGESDEGQSSKVTSHRSPPTGLSAPKREVGWPPAQLDGSIHTPGARIDAHERSVEPVADPHLARTCRQRGRGAPDVDGVRDLQGARVHPGDDVVQRPGHPDGVARGGHSATDREGDPRLADHLSPLRVDLPDAPVRGVAEDPDRAPSRGHVALALPKVAGRERLREWEREGLRDAQAARPLFELLGVRAAAAPQALRGTGRQAARHEARCRPPGSRWRRRTRRRCPPSASARRPRRTSGRRHRRCPSDHPRGCPPPRWNRPA